MRALVQCIRDNLLATPDTVCLQRARLVTEAYRQHEDDPAPLKRAKAFAHVLRHMGLDVQPNPIFAGNTFSRSRAWILIPEHHFSNETQVLIENDGLDDILEGQIPGDLRDFWAKRSFGGGCGIGHLAVDLEMVVHRGLESSIAETRRFRDEADPDKKAYREAIAIALQAVIDWAGRYADAAEAAARSEADPVVREAHLRVAEACRHVPRQPARNLFEGLQAITLVHLALAIEGHGMSISIGLPDRVLAPFIDDTFEPEYTTNLVGAFMLKLDAARDYRGGCNLNLTLPRSTATPDRLRALVEAFFGEGGQELQINCLDAATLRAARENPEAHQDLVVRVAGFGARFIDLSRAEQEELIARAEHEEGLASQNSSN